jgi:plastocyanin
MALRPIFLLIGSLAIAIAIEAAAPEESISGQLVITRALTKQRVTLPVYEDRGVALRRHEGVASKPASEWDRVVVYLEGDRAPRAAPVTASMIQRGEHFDPEMLIVPAGSTVAFPNADPIFHNVFSLSKTREFDLGFYPAGETRSVRFDKAGVVQVYCHLHPEMNAAVLVAPNAWFTRPNGQGVFSFSGIPAGAYQVVVWHRSAGYFRKTILVPQSGTVRVSMEIPLGANESRP